MNSEVNEILKVYLGAGTDGGYQPIGKDERFRGAYPNDHVAKLEQIEKYLKESHPPEAWSQEDLVQEQMVFENMLTKKFPELDKTASHSLACRWSFGWK